MKKIFLYIKWFFISIFLGGDKIKSTEKHIEPQPVISTSKEQQQEELHKFLTEECIIYDPNSPEAIAELKIMDEMLGDINEDNFYEIETGDDKLKNMLTGKTKS